MSLKETCSKSGYFYVIDEDSPHLGGNIIGGDPNSCTPELWDWLIKEFKVNRVLDVGCGEGSALDYFISKGCKGVGIEGLQENVYRARNKVILCDLTKAYVVVPEKVDLVWCCELVEHIEEKSIHNLLKTLSNGKIIAMTHAVAGQGGHHHVNCQSLDYWVKYLNGYGYDLLSKETTYARSISTVNSHFNNSGLVFQRRNNGKL